MTLLTTLFIVAAMTLVAYALRHAGIVRTCPVCVGVVLTWMLLIALRFLGFEIEQGILALLLGGSVVGATEKLHQKRSMHPLLKGTVIIIGFAVAYNIALEEWTYAALAIALLAILLFFAESGKKEHVRSKEEQELITKMDDCC